MSARIARVVVDIALDREFDYLIPDGLRDSVFLGSRVAVPFGRSRTTGYVVSLPNHSDRTDLKEILSVAGRKPLVSERLLDLARWMADYYCAPVEQAIRTVLPGAIRRPGAAFKKRMFVRLCDDLDAVRSMIATEAIDKERSSSGTARQLVAPKLRSEGGSLVLPGIAERSVSGERASVLTSRSSHIRPTERNRALRPGGLSPKQRAVLSILVAKGGMFLHELLGEAGVTSAPVRALEKKGLVSIEPESSRRDPLAHREILRTEPLKLMPEQARSLEMIRECVERSEVRGQRSEVRGRKSEGGTIAESGSERPDSSVVLLYGVTGSGKTEVYLQAIDHVLKKGMGAIVLVPEISLTPQTVERFVGRFGERVAVLHSRLSDGERHDEWHRIHDGKADIVVGARSAVFAPVGKLGLIVVDEEHEPTYKQEEAPRYNARDVAVMRGHMEGCAVVLGSATPSLESWQNARSGKYKLAILLHRADGRRMPVMRIIDMRVETAETGHASVFSKALLDAIRLRLDRAEQTILFLNRRGFSTSLVCPRCGYVAKCDQCSVSLTYHRTDDKLHCHICGDSRTVPQACPGCNDPSFKYAGVGTQRVEAIVQRLFPRAKVQRMDTDVTTRKDSHDRILGDFRTGKIDILIGTQMIAKGLHFPNVTLVGVIYADLSLHMPDFRAGERTFQLLAQVAGRAGRGEVPGEVIVQTYTPFHTAVQAARRVDYDGFCDQELEFRRSLSYPPCSHLVCITLKGQSESKVSFCAATLVRRLKPKLAGKVILSNPAPAPIVKAKGMFRYQVMMRCASVRAMTDPLKQVLTDFKLPQKMTCSVDVDAVSLL